MFSSDRTDWETPNLLYDYLNTYFGPFNLDAAASMYNAKCAEYFTKEDNGLLSSWQGHNVYVNPPYGRGITGKWVNKAYKEVYDTAMYNSRIVVEKDFTVGDMKPPTKVTMLLPARTETKFFKMCANAQQIYFITGRIYFELNGEQILSEKTGKPTPAPFPSVIVVFDSEHMSIPPSWGFIDGKSFKKSTPKHNVTIECEGGISCVKEAVNTTS
jgi:site-specific DNA-methyltransferase (adenine-specific)